ncbi:MAG: zinc-ribbon domain-containing protein [Candidatus Bathyarchaeota archaeon]
MNTCPKCGEENRKEAVFCRKCGEKLQTNIYRKQREPWGVVHIAVLLFSVVLLITAFGLVMGGTSLRGIQEIMTDEDGYIMSNTKHFQASSYAIVAEEMDIEIDPVAWRFFERSGGFLKFKIITENNDPSKEVFVGVARYEDAFNYINPMEYHEVSNLDLGWQNFDTGTSQATYTLHPGSAPVAPPTVNSFWIVHGADAGPQTLTWEPESGRYYLILMNADGSAGIDADVKLGVQIPFFSGLGNILIMAGIVVGTFGVLMLYFTIRRNQP